MNKILEEKSIKKQIQKINGCITFCSGITVLPVGRGAVFGSCGFRRRYSCWNEVHAWRCGCRCSLVRRTGRCQQVFIFAGGRAGWRKTSLCHHYSAQAQTSFHLYSYRKKHLYQIEYHLVGWGTLEWSAQLAWHFVEWLVQAPELWPHIFQLRRLQKGGWPQYADRLSARKVWF